VVTAKAGAPAIHQFVPRLEWGAVGGHVLALQALAAEMTGRPSVVFAGSAAPALADRCRPVRDYGRQVPSTPDDVLIYQSAIGSPVGEFVRRRRARLVVNFHNLTPIGYLQAWDPDATEGVLLGEQQLRRLAPRCSLAIADSSFNADHLRESGYPTSVIAVAPVLADLDALDVPDGEAGARLMAAKAGGGADWLFVGRISANKCQHRLVGALAAYRRAYDPHARLWLVGGDKDSRYGRVVRAFTQSLGLGDAVTITGSVPPPVLAAHYRHADVFVCLSEHEGFCVPLVEAMHHGVPVVATGSSAVPETVQGAGVVLPMAGATGPTAATVAAAVHRVLCDPVVHQRLIAAGHRRSGELALAPTRERYRALLQRVLDR